MDEGTKEESMNERYHKLANEAWCSVNQRIGFNDAQRRELFEREYAELILAECVGICLDRHHTWRWDNEPDSSSGPRDCAQSIKEHFGVEE